MDRFKFISTGFGISMTGLAGMFINSGFFPEREELVKIWQASETLTLQFAEAMPESDYGFQPAGLETVYTYGEQMQHIADNNISLLSRYLTGKRPPEFRDPGEYDKPAIITNIRSSFEYGTGIIRELSTESLGETVDFFARPFPRWHVLFIAQDHTTHHCGQAVVYLNAKGITPPTYRKW